MRRIDNRLVELCLSAVDRSAVTPTLPSLCLFVDNSRRGKRGGRCEFVCSRLTHVATHASLPRDRPTPSICRWLLNQCGRGVGRVADRIGRLAGRGRPITVRLTRSSRKARDSPSRPDGADVRMRAGNCVSWLSDPGHRAATVTAKCGLYRAVSEALEHTWITQASTGTTKRP